MFKLVYGFDQDTKSCGTIAVEKTGHIL